MGSGPSRRGSSSRRAACIGSNSSAEFAISNNCPRREHRRRPDARRRLAVRTKSTRPARSSGCRQPGDDATAVVLLVAQPGGGGRAVRSAGCRDLWRARGATSGGSRRARHGRPGLVQGRRCRRHELRPVPPPVQAAMAVSAADRGRSGIGQPDCRSSGPGGAAVRRQNTLLASGLLDGGATSRSDRSSWTCRSAMA
jgi:hypothetical protein